MKKVILSLAVVALVIIAVAKYAKHDEGNISADGKPIVRIGAILPLSGDLAPIGEGIKNAILLASEDLKDPKAPIFKNDYEFIIDDNSFDVRKIPPIFSKMTGIDKIDAVIDFATTTGKVVSPRAEAAKIIHLNIAASDPVVAEGGYNFINWTLLEETVRKMVEYHKKKGYGKVTVIAGNDAGVIAITDEYKKQAAAAGLAAEFFYFQPNEKDFRLLLEKTRAYGSDVYLLMAWNGNAIPLLKQFREARINKPITNIETFAMLEQYDGLDGLVYSDAAIADSGFYRRLAERFPNNPSEFATGNVYDGVMMLVSAFEAAPTKEQAVEALAEIKEYHGVIGKTIQDDRGIFQAPASLKQLVGRQAVVVEE